MKRAVGTFSAKLNQMFIVGILIPFFIAFLVFVAYSIWTVVEREEKSAQNILNSVSQSLELQFAENEKIKDMFYISKEVFQEAERLNNPQLYTYYDDYSNAQIENAYTGVFTKMLYTSQQNVRAITFFPMSGEGDTAYYLGKSKAKIREITYPDYKGTRWFLEAVNEIGKQFYYAPHMPEYLPNKNLGEVYSYVNAIWDNDTRRAIGVVKIDIDAKEIQEKLDMLEDLKGCGMLLWKEGEIFAKSKNLGEEIELRENGQLFIDSKRYKIKQQKIPNTDLEIVYVSSILVVYWGHLYVLVFTAAFILVELVLAFANYRYQASTMMKDIENITMVARCVERGNLDLVIDIRKDSEFREIANVINHMIGELKNYIEKEYVLTIQQQKAQYRALQAQINPHFFYNTLNGFVALNRMGEKKLLEKSINGLSRMFRYVCSNMETASIADELNFLKQYLELEKLKYDGRLEYIIWADEACKGKKIPKLLLQPAVENSILHGMGDTDRSIMIQIAACCLHVKGIGSVMSIIIRDNGVGFVQRDEDSPEGSVGLTNVKMRTELFCKNAMYQCTSKVGIGTKTTFVFPDLK